MKNEYLSYDALQLAAENSFIQWVKEEAGPHASSWEVWLKDHPQMEGIVKEAKEVVEENLKLLVPIPHKINAENLWDRIDSSTGTELPLKEAKTRRLRPLYIGIAIAAAIAIILLIFPNLPSETQLRSPNGEHLAFVLPDSSAIELNAASSLRYSEKGFSKKREVYLDGEAFFEVEKGENFLVKTELGTVRVLGTSFNVYEREGNFEVQCLTGKVEVSNQDQSEKVILTPGEVVSLNPQGKLAKQESEIPTFASWRDYKFTYEKTPLIEVLEEIKRQFNVEIDFQGVDLNEEYSGEFEGRDLENVLEDVLWPLNLAFNIEAKRVIISEE